MNNAANTKIITDSEWSDGTVFLLTKWERVCKHRKAAHYSSARNFGWKNKEGTHCYEPANDCESGGLVDPVMEYPHKDGDCSITGGFVYRGPDPALQGIFFYKKKEEMIFILFKLLWIFTSSCFKERK